MLSLLYQILFNRSHLSRYETDEPQRNLVGPRQMHELVPPPGHNLSDVEPSQEGYRDQVGEPACVHAHNLKHLPVKVVGEEDIAVEQA